MSKDGYVEDGLTLSRLVAAEKNALAGVEIARIARKGESDLRQRVTQLEAEVAALKLALDQLRVNVAVWRHSGGSGGGHDQGRG